MSAHIYITSAIIICAAQHRALAGVPARLDSDLRPGASFRLRAAPGSEPHNRWGARTRGFPGQWREGGLTLPGIITRPPRWRPDQHTPSASPNFSGRQGNGGTLARSHGGDVPTSPARRKARGASALPVNEGRSHGSGRGACRPCWYPLQWRPQTHVGSTLLTPPPGTLTLSIKLPP